jgi:hypothetical protein
MTDHVAPIPDRPVETADCVDESDGTSSEFQVVAAAIARGKTQVEAAALVSRSERTLRRWADREEFKSALRAERRLLREEVRGERIVLRQNALHVLSELLGSKDDHLRLRAAVAFLRTSSTSDEIDELGERLDAVAAQLDGRHG